MPKYSSHIAEVVPLLSVRAGSLYLTHTWACRNSSPWAVAD